MPKAISIILASVLLLRRLRPHLATASLDCTIGLTCQTRRARRPRLARPVHYRYKRAVWNSFVDVHNDHRPASNLKLIQLGSLVGERYNRRIDVSEFSTCVASPRVRVTIVRLVLPWMWTLSAGHDQEVPAARNGESPTKRPIKTISRNIAMVSIIGMMINFRVPSMERGRLIHIIAMAQTIFR